jgi:hypothetical protein
MVQSLRPGTISTFEKYADNLFIPHILSCLNDVSRLDIVGDIYKMDNINTALKRKEGVVFTNV